MTWRRVRKSLRSKRNQSEFEDKKAQIEQLNELGQAEYIDLFYYDESHFGLTPVVPYAWQEREKPVLLPSARGKTINVAGFFSKKNTLFSYQVSSTLNSQKLVTIFDDFAQKTTKKTVVILDNSPIHTSKYFKGQMHRWQEEHDLYLFFLPAYSPELNCIEILWREIKYRWLGFKAYTSFENLSSQLDSVLKGVGTKFNINFG